MHFLGSTFDVREELTVCCSLCRSVCNFRLLSPDTEIMPRASGGSRAPGFRCAGFARSYGAAAARFARFLTEDAAMTFCLLEYWIVFRVIRDKSYK